MKRIPSLFFILFTVFTTVSSAQNTAPTWTAFYRGAGDNSDKIDKIISDGFGNFIAVGYTVKNGNYKDYLTIKLNANGDTLWWRSKNGSNSGDDEATCAGVDSAGNVFVSGYTDGGNSNNDILTIKYDSSGNVLWYNTWNSPAFQNDAAVELRVDKNGNCIIGGNTQPDTVSGSSDYITLKYDPTGALLWSAQYSHPAVTSGKDVLAGIDIDSVGDVYVTGRSYNGSNDDFATIKYDGVTGTQDWLQPYNGGAGNDRAVDIVIDHGGNVLVTGRSDNGSNDDYRTIKYNNAGLLQWLKAFNAPANQNDRPTNIAVDLNDNVYVTGQSDIDQSSTVNYDFLTVKYNSAGTQQWFRLNGNIYQQDDIPNDLAVDSAGNVFVTGKTDTDVNPLHTDNDFMTIAYSTSGTTIWGPVFHSGSRVGDDDIAYSILIDGLGNIYVAGASGDTITEKDATVVKYNAAGGTETWVKNYNGVGDFNDNLKGIVVDANNYSYAEGYSFGESNNLDAFLEKVDPAGNVVCYYKYQGVKNDDDEFNTIALSSNGIVYAAGYTKVSGQKSNFLLVKWDPSICDTVWTWTYDYINKSDQVLTMVLDPAGNIYLAGRSDSNPNDTLTNYDILTMKLDNNANILWSQRFNNSAGNSSDEPVKIILDNTGNVLVGGRTANIHDDDFIVIKYNASTGAPIWASPIFYAGPFANDDEFADMLVDTSNNIFMCGYSKTGSGNASQDPVVLKYDASGNMQGFFSYSGDDKDQAVKLALDIHNNIYGAFKTDVDGGIPNAHNFDYNIRKFDNNLTELWPTPADYDNPLHLDDAPSDLTISAGGDIYITGTSNNDTLGGRTNKNWVTVGYDESGAQIFISNYDGPNATDDSPNALIIRGTILWVDGYTEGTGSNQKDATVNNYSLLGVGINEISGMVSSTVYPNPFNTDCKITLVNTVVKKPVYLQLYDMLGNAMTSQILFTGNYVQVNKGSLSSGIYEYRILSDASVISRGKLIVN